MCSAPSSVPARVSPRRFAIIEQSVLQRRRAEQLLSVNLGLKIVSVSSTIREFMSWLRSTDRSGWPHLLVLNFPSLSSPPGESGSDDLKVIKKLREAGIRVLVLSALYPRAAARRLLDIGVDGIVSTSDGEKSFVSAADAVLAGQSSISPRALEAIDGTRGPGLSVQEQRVLNLYATGLPINEIAARIGVREDTARKYLARVKAKYAAAGRPARSKLELAQAAWTDGYVGSATAIGDSAVQGTSRSVSSGRRAGGSVRAGCSAQ